MSTLHRFAPTCAMRPTTRSPISGVYRLRRAAMLRSLFVRVRVPATVDDMRVGSRGSVAVPWPLRLCC